VHTNRCAESSFSLKSVISLARKLRLPTDRCRPRWSFGNLSFCSRGVAFLTEIQISARGLVCTLASGRHETSCWDANYWFGQASEFKTEGAYTLPCSYRLQENLGALCLKILVRKTNIRRHMSIILARRRIRWWPVYLYVSIGIHAQIHTNNS
jgi:hypothetical protein